MTRRLIIRPIAADEIEEAFHWYEQQREGLGADFRLCVEEALDRIQRMPFAAPVAFRHLRRALIRRFPYGLFYTVSDDALIVVAVYHASRDPKRLRHRT